MLYYYMAFENKTYLLILTKDIFVTYSFNINCSVHHHHHLI